MEFRRITKSFVFMEYKIYFCCINTTIMAKIFLSITVAMCLVIACTKEPIQGTATTNQTQITSLISFKYDGNQKNYQQVAGARVSTGTQGTYSFTGTKEPSSINFFSMVLHADSLRVGTYVIYPTGVVNYREGNDIATNVSGGGITLIVTSNSHGLINGYFSGSLYDHNDGTNKAVTEGKIQNLQLSYQ